MPRIDLHCRPLHAIVGTIDVVLDEMHARVEASEDPDGMGLLDMFEAYVGLGFITCQSYLVTRLLDRDRAVAYACGPIHTSGFHVARLVHVGANFWKHHPEWPRDESEFDARQTTIVEILDRLGVWGHSYPMTSLLHELVAPEPMRFAPLCLLLGEWRSALDPGDFIQ